MCSLHEVRNIEKKTRVVCGKVPGSPVAALFRDTVVNRQTRSDLFLTKCSLQILYSLGIQASDLVGGVPRDQCFVFKMHICRVKIRQKCFKNRVSYYSNFDATFNVLELCITLSGDVHPMPEPDENRRTIAVFSRTKLDRPKNANRGHVMNNCARVQITKSQHLIRVNNTNPIQAT